MENKPKSKAFIITFIIVIALLFGGYLLLRNSGSSETKGQTTIGKIFAPLLGTAKEKKLTPINNTDPTTDTTITVDPNLSPTSGSGDDITGINNQEGLPGGDLEVGNLDSGDLSFNNLNSLPSPKSSSTIKPSKNAGGIASAGKGTLTGSDSKITVKESLCPVDDPLTNYFTDQEKKDLDNYLRQFYLIAPTIRTTDDILIAENEILENTSFGGNNGQLEQLIADCNKQKADPSYTGPQIVKDNPYYQGNSPYERDTYLPNSIPKSVTHGQSTFMGKTYESIDPTKQSFNLFEKLLYIW